MSDKLIAAKIYKQIYFAISFLQKTLDTSRIFAENLDCTVPYMRPAAGEHMPHLCKTIGSNVAVILSGALAILALFGGAISGIWLVLIGEWNAVLMGFVFSMTMPVVFTIVCLPMIFVVVLLIGNDSPPNRTMFTIGSFMSSFWVALLISAWTLFIFHYFIEKSDSDTFALLALLGYSITMSPIVYMASKETEESIGTAFGIILAVLSYALLLILHLAGLSWENMAVAVFSLAAIDALFIMLLSSPSPELNSKGQNAGRLAYAQPRTLF